MAKNNGPSAAAVVEIDATRAFLAVARRGGVTAAAQEIGRTPAAISMQLKKLEDTLGAALFTRSSRGMTLTEEGGVFEEHAHKIMAAHDAALEAFRGSPLSGHVRIGTVDEFGDLHLSKLLAQFAKAHPEVCVSVVIGSSFELSDEIAGGAVDLALLIPGGDCPWLDSDEVIHSEPLSWIGLQGGTAQARTPLPVAMARPGCAWRRMAIAALERGGTAYRVAYASNTYAGQMASVYADLAVAPAPVSALRPGFVTLGPSDRLPELGECRVAMRYAEGARDREEVVALGRLLRGSFCDRELTAA